MAIKWSALKVSEAMDEVEHQVCLADSFIAEARDKTEQARNIANLPEYMHRRLIRVVTLLERMESVKGAIKAVRDDIPEQDLAEERELAQYGSQPGLGL